MLITQVQIAGCRELVDVRCARGLVCDIGPSLPRLHGEPVIAGEGGALLPGLHDHHIHLFALAARRQSVSCGPPAVCNRDQLIQALRAAPGTDWVRGVDYHESVAGALNRRQLDAWLPQRPVKIQHRSGKLWIVNSLAAQALDLDAHAGLSGVSLDAAGRPDGRLFRLDDWMRAQQAQRCPEPLPSLAAVSHLLASFGVTGVTDASPRNDAHTLQAFVRAADTGELRQRLRVMGDDDLPDFHSAQVQCGERKVMLDDDALPAWDTLQSVFTRAHRAGRSVAVHCVTPAELVLALSVLRATGALPGDRIEHASLVPDALLPLLREVGVRVVTQPGFVHERGDAYAAQIAPAEQGDLYRCRVLLTQGIPLAGSTDAPFGDPDPWAAMRAAVARRSRSGIALGPDETLTPEQALALFTGAAEAPGGPGRRIAVGAVADLCLLDRPWKQARLRLCSEDVRATLRGGEPIYLREPLEQVVSQTTAQLTQPLTPQLTSQLTPRNALPQAGQHAADAVNAR